MFSRQIEEAFSSRLYQMQTRIKQLETRLRITVEDAQLQRKERIAWEKQIVELKRKTGNLEREKHDAVAKVQDYIQLLEEANLQKSRVSQMLKIFLSY